MQTNTSILISNTFSFSPCFFEFIFSSTHIWKFPNNSSIKHQRHIHKTGIIFLHHPHLVTNVVIIFCTYVYLVQDNTEWLKHCLQVKEYSTHRIPILEFDP